MERRFLQPRAAYLLATVNISGKPQEHGSDIKTSIGAIMESLFGSLGPSLVWPYYPQ